MKKKTPLAPAPQSPVQQQSFDISQQQRDAQNAQVGQANQTIGTAQQAVSPYLAGSSGMSEFRRGLTGALAHSTATSGDNAIARSRERAQAAGFGGGGQPMQYAAETGLANEQAGRIAQIPAQVEQQAAPLELQAAGQESGLAGQQLNAAHVYNPESYYGTGAQLAGQNQQDYYNQLAEQRKKKAGIWGSLAKIGLGVGGNLLAPGVGTAMTGMI